MKIHCDLRWLCFVPLALLLTGTGFGQQTERQNAPISVVQDWSHRHLIFTNGGSPESVVRAQRDPRFWHNWFSRSLHMFPPALGSDSNSFSMSSPAWDDLVLEEEQWRFPGWRPTKGRHGHSKTDWAVSLGGNGTNGSGGVAPGESPAKFTFDINAPISCQNDFVVFVIQATPSARQANIVALNNLYSGTSPTGQCGTAPTFLWSYSVGSGDIHLSPVLSLDGKKVAFVETAAHPMFDVLTWAASQGTDATHPAIPGTGGSSVTRLDYTNTAVPGCPASAATSDNDASPYIDYTNDAAYIGADNGVLYRIKSVFNGTPTLDYCITVNAGANLSSAVFDSVTGKVFVSDGATVYAFTPGATSFAPAGSIAVASSGIVLSPIVDSTSGFVYVFASHDLSGTHTVVSQMPTSLATHVDALIGPATTQFEFDGDFDNKYYTTGPAAGTLYACGVKTGSTNSVPALYTITFGATGTMNATPTMSSNTNIDSDTTHSQNCSPFLDFFDGTNDRLFVGVGHDGSTRGSNLVTMWNVNTRITSSTALPTASATNEWGGTSGFSIDNVSTAPQAASIYFGTRATNSTTSCGSNVYCAVKLTQSALQ